MSARLLLSMSWRGHLAAKSSVWPSPQLPMSLSAQVASFPCPAACRGSPKQSSPGSDGLSFPIWGVAAEDCCRKKARVEYLLLPSVLLAGEEVGPAIDPLLLASLLFW